MRTLVVGVRSTIRGSCDAGAPSHGVGGRVGVDSASISTCVPEANLLNVSSAPECAPLNNGLGVSPIAGTRGGRADQP
jgi:hypothetical protein